MRQYRKEELYPHSKRLSSSQILDYCKDPSRFHYNWVLGVERGIGKAMAFGIAFSEAYADRSWDYVGYCRELGVPRRLIELMSNVLPLFPVLPKKACEYELLVKHKGWEIRVTLDAFLVKQGIIVENKTGEGFWNQEVCDSHPQLTLQQWAYWRKYKKLPKQHIVNWVDTSARATKPIHTFKTKRTVTELKAFEESVLEHVIRGLEVGDFTGRPLYSQRF